MPQADLKAVLKDESVFITRGDRSYRIRSLDQNLSRNVMKVNVMAYRGEAFHMDVLNLYSAYHRSGFAKTAAKELGVAEEVIEKDLGKLLLKLEELQEQQIDQTLTPVDPAVELSEAERAEALAFLHSPNLLDRILQDFETCGIVGEETNKLVGYLVAVSRKLPQPLGALIQSSSASGKTTTMDSILAFVPKEDLVKYHHGPGPVLQGRKRSAAQDHRHRGGGRRGKGQLPAETVAERRRTDHRLHRQEPDDRQPRHPGLPRQGTCGRVRHHHRRRNR